MTEEIWRLPRMLAVTGMKRTWTYDEIKAERFPRPIKLGARAVGWRRSDIEAWLASREPKSAQKLHTEAEAMLAHADALESEGAN